MSSSFSAPKGTYDLIPPESEVFLAVREAMAAPLRRASYGYVETPTFEQTALFERGVGESTDVVSKEMYSFTTRGGDHLSLKPEGTAGVVRAVVQHKLYAGQLPVKLWYSGSYYRYERPQAGRYRHFSQVGAEALGVDDPALDAEIVSLGSQVFRDLGLTQVRLLLNSLGDAACRPVYRAALVEFLSALDLDEETRRRIEVNPLRVLDDKRPEVAAQVAAAPLMTDSLCDACREHYDHVRDYLRDLDVTWEEAPRLVRGLDYYTRTTFEFVHDGLGAQSAVGGGGRYDGLSEQVGGPPLPGVGWALGVDRTVLALRAEGVQLALPRRCDVYVVPLGDRAKKSLVPVVRNLRSAGITTDIVYGTRGMKGAMRAADRSGARVAIIVGDRDLDLGVVSVQDLSTGATEQMSGTALSTYLRSLLAVPVTDEYAASADLSEMQILDLFSKARIGNTDALEALGRIYEPLADQEANRLEYVWFRSIEGEMRNVLAVELRAQLALRQAFVEWETDRATPFVLFAQRFITRELVTEEARRSPLSPPDPRFRLQRDSWVLHMLERDGLLRDVTS